MILTMFKCRIIVLPHIDCRLPGVTLWATADH